MKSNYRGRHYAYLYVYNRSNTDDSRILREKEMQARLFAAKHVLTKNVIGPNTARTLANQIKVKAHATVINCAELGLITCSGWQVIEVEEFGPVSFPPAKITRETIKRCGRYTARNSKLAQGLTISGDTIVDLSATICDIYPEYLERATVNALEHALSRNMPTKNGWVVSCTFGPWTVVDNDFKEIEL